MYTIQGIEFVSLVSWQYDNTCIPIRIQVHVLVLWKLYLVFFCIVLYLLDFRQLPIFSNLAYYTFWRNGQLAKIRNLNKIQCIWAIWSKFLNLYCDTCIEIRIQNTIHVSSKTCIVLSCIVSFASAGGFFKRYERPTIQYNTNVLYCICIFVLYTTLQKIKEVVWAPIATTTTATIVYFLFLGFSRFIIF